MSEKNPSDDSKMQKLLKTKQETGHDEVATPVTKLPQASDLNTYKPSQVHHSDRGVSFGTTTSTSSFNSETSGSESTVPEEYVHNSNRRKKTKRPSEIFHLIDKLDWDKVNEFAESNPNDLKKYERIPIRTEDTKMKVKRLPLHHACAKLKHVINQNKVIDHSYSTNISTNLAKATSAICTMIAKYPKAASVRESHHGCYAIHLLAFYSALPIPTTKHFNQGHGINLSADSLISEALTPLNSNQSDNKRKKKNYTASQQHVRKSLAFSPSPSKPGRKIIRTNTLTNQEQNEALLSILNALVEAYPKGPSADSQTGRLPLHMACTGRATLPVFKRLLDLYPDAARRREHVTSSLPLHLIAECGVSHPDVVDALLRCYPEAILGKNKFGRTPYDQALFVAGENGRSYQPEILRALCYDTRLGVPSQLFYSLASDEDSNLGQKQTNLQSTAELDFVIGGKVENDEGDGLGSRVRYMEKNKTQQSMWSLDINSAINTPKQAKDLAYKTELTDLINHKQWPSVSIRIEMYPNEASEWINVTSRSGRLVRLLPLHYACERTPPIEAIKALVKAYPQSIMIPSTPVLQLPLHLACTWHAPSDVICFLIAENSESALERDEYGNLPIHSACYSGASLDVIKKLMDANPKGALTRNDLDRNCLDITRSIKHDNWKQIETLIRSDLQNIDETDVNSV